MPGLWCLECWGDESFSAHNAGASDHLDPLPLIDDQIKSRMLNLLFLVMLIAGLLMMYASSALVETEACDSGSGCNPGTACLWSTCYPVDMYCILNCMSCGDKPCKCFTEIGECRGNPLDQGRICLCSVCELGAYCAMGPGGDD